MEDNPSDRKLISRRSFLRISAVGGTALLLDGCLPPIPPNEPVGQNPETSVSQPKDLIKEQQERFKKLGMEDFWRFYQIVHNTESKYCSAGRGDYFRAIYSLCNQVAQGTIEEGNPELVRVRDGWGEKKETAIESAQSHVKAITVNPVNEASDDPEAVKKNQLKNFAESFAPMALSLPRNLYLIKFGAGQTDKEYIAAKSFADFEPWVSWQDFFHEATHSADTYFERVKPYVDRKQYID